MPQPQCVGCQDGQRCWRLALAGEDVQHDIGGVHALAQRLGAGGFDGTEAVAEHGGEDVDHLPVAVNAPWPAVKVIVNACPSAVAPCHSPARSWTSVSVVAARDKLAPPSSIANTETTAIPIF